MSLCALKPDEYTHKYYTYIVTRRQNSNTFSNCIYIYFRWDMLDSSLSFVCLVCISPFHVHILFRIYLSLSFAGQKNFLPFWYVCVVWVQSIFMADCLLLLLVVIVVCACACMFRICKSFCYVPVFTFTHMVRTPPTNAHCYRNAGHHSYRTEE